MGKVITQFTMSLDGFIAGPDDGVWPLFNWYTSGDTEFPVVPGRPPFPVPCFIVTHTPPQEWLKEGSPFTFVTDGVGSAVAKATQAAGDKHVAVSGTKIVQQCLQAGLFDEINIDLASLLLGEGIRLFDNLGNQLIELENKRVIEGKDVIRLRFRVVK